MSKLQAVKPMKRNLHAKQLFIYTVIHSARRFEETN